jgi:hypothetical protein
MNVMASIKEFGAYGNPFQRVTLGAHLARRGLLGKGAILTNTSNRSERPGVARQVDHDEHPA